MTTATVKSIWTEQLKNPDNWENVADIGKIEGVSVVGKEFVLWKDHALNDVTFHGIDLTPRDFVKFGHLYAQKGTWKGQQLINESFLEQSMQPISAGPGELYGMHTSIRKITNEKRLLVKEGFNGQYLFVIPEENLVAVKFTKYLHCDINNIRTKVFC